MCVLLDGGLEYMVDAHTYIHTHIQSIIIKYLYFSFDMWETNWGGGKKLDY